MEARPNEQTDSLESLREELALAKAELQSFISIASHDLQAPLRKIVAFSGLLREEYGKVLKEEGGHYLDRVQSSTGKMQRLLDDLRLLSRITSRAEPFRNICLNTIFREVLDEMKDAISRCNAKITTENFPTIDGDPNQIRQLLQNLIGNALKFHEKDQPPILALGSRRTEDDTVEITVKDNGIGFDPKYLERIFKPFNKLHGNSAYEGSGMGLAICEKIVRRHNGNITASATPGLGATFIVRLPVHQHIQNEKTS
jgi:light-regulated signal transduction histidine kinase (bacteriophytochrome)